MGSSGSALRVCADHRGGINWLSLSPDGQRLLTGSEDGTARLWSTVDGQCCALLQGRWTRVLATFPASSRSPAPHPDLTLPGPAAPFWKSRALAPAHPGAPPALELLAGSREEPECA